MVQKFRFVLGCVLYEIQRMSLCPRELSVVFSVPGGDSLVANETNLIVAAVNILKKLNRIKQITMCYTYEE